MNPNNDLMTIPYNCSMVFLSMIKGSRINDWVGDQISDLIEKVTQVQNQLD